MEPVSITTTLIIAFIQSKAFQDFISRTASRIASDAYRSRFNDKQGGGNLPALSEAQQRCLTAQNDREERGLELQRVFATTSPAKPAPRSSNSSNTTIP